MNLRSIKSEFPIFYTNPGGFELTYLDNAATTQKPLKVINSIVSYYYNHNANVHRGIHALSESATSLYENSRKMFKEFINASNTDEIIFTSGSTDGINMIANGFAENILDENNGVLCLISEHHSNFVPWQQLCLSKNAPFEVVSLDEEFRINVADLKSKLATGKFKIFAFAHISNVLGIVNDVKKITSICKEHKAFTVLDCAQSAGRVDVDVQSFDVDFAVFSSHKMYGTTGLGILYAKNSNLEFFAPTKFGGGMIDVVNILDSTWTKGPEKYEAGTPNIEGVITLAESIKFINEIGIKEIKSHENSLISYLIDQLKHIPEIKIIGPANSSDRAGLVSFYSDKIHSHDISSVLASTGIAVRAGHHCAMLFHRSLNIPSSVRASFAVYISFEDLDKLIEGIKSAFRILK